MRTGKTLFEGIGTGKEKKKEKKIRQERSRELVADTDNRSGDFSNFAELGDAVLVFGACSTPIPIAECHDRVSVGALARATSSLRKQK